MSSTIDNRKTVVTSWDDTSKTDIKLSQMLEKYNIDGTFFVVTNQIGRSVSKEDISDLAQRFEVGSHSVTHLSLPGTSIEVLNRELCESKRELEEILDFETTSFCYPYGNYDNLVVQQVMNAGYRCARTFDPYHFERQSDVFRINVGVWAEPHGFLYKRGVKNTMNLLSVAARNDGFFQATGTLLRIRNWLQLSKKLFDLFMESGSIFHLVGHAWRIENRNEWKELEEVLSYISDRKGIRYLNVGEYAITP